MAKQGNYSLAELRRIVRTDASSLSKAESLVRSVVLEMVRNTDEVPVMDVPGHGVFPVLRVFTPSDSLPSDDEETRRFLVTKDGTAYQVPLNAERVSC